MRVLHLIGQEPTKTGSGTTYRAIIEGFDKFDYEQEAIYGLNSDQDIVDPGCDCFPVIFCPDKDNMPLFGMSDIMPYESFQYKKMTEEQYDHRHSKFLEIIEERIKSFKPDIIISHHLHLLTAETALNFDIPLFAVIHGTDLAQLEGRPDHKEIVEKALDKIKLIFTNSPAQDQEIIDFLGVEKEKLVVLGGGFEPELFYPKEVEKTDVFSMIFAGKISEHKGLRVLYHALDKIKDEFDFKLHICGTGAGGETDKIIELGERFNLPIKYHGFVNKKDLGELYHSMDAFVLPSFAEGLSLATLEALGAGLLSIVGAWPNLMGFLPERFKESGQITFVERFSENIIDEEDERFFKTVDAWADAILKAKANYKPNQYINPEDFHILSWQGRIELLNESIKNTM